MNADPQDLLDRLRDVLAAAAPHAPTEDAALAAFWLVQAELLGLPEFGIRMLARDLARLASATTRAPAPAAPSPVSAVDATGIPGVLALAAAVSTAAGQVRTHGLAVVGIRGAGALGVLGTAARTLAAEGATALIAAQSPAFVAPWGATTAAIGTNPLALGTPRQDAAPLILDFATSPVTLAAVRQAAAAGEPLAPGIAVDAQGRPTLDAAAAAALLPSGLVGSLAGLFVEVLGGVATGGRAPDGDASAGRGAMVIAFDTARTGASDAPAAARRLEHDWAAAGGHVPSRFDVLPLHPADLPGSVDIDERDATWLEGALR